MAVPLYLEHFLDSLETLPGELQRNFTLMKDMDTRSQDLVKKIHHQSEEYIGKVGELRPPEKTEKMREIHEMFEKAKEFSDEKVALSMQTYEMVDKHIRRLDSELAKLEAELKEKQLTGSGSGSVTTEEFKKKGRAAGRDKKSSSFNPKNVIKEEPEKGKKQKKQKVQIEAAVATVAVLPEAPLLSVLAGSSEVLDMPVDPNEPTYCLCHQVSYGEMIGCDNADCPIEWFHFGCVGLTIKPKGKWFCPKCITDRKKK